MENSDQPLNCSGNQHYNLKWTNHTNNILTVLTENLLKECLVDVTLTCEGQYIKAHRMILSACSLYFQEVFQMHAVENPLIIMNGVRFNILKQIVEFMYKGEIKVIDSDLEQLLLVAENLQIKGLCNVRGKSIAQDTQEGSTVENTTVEETNTHEWQKARKKRKKSPVPVEDNNVDLSEQNNKVVPTLKDMLGEDLGRPEPMKRKRQSISDDIETFDLTTPPIFLPGEAVTIVDSPNEKFAEKAAANKIPRPPNAFMIFANEWRKKLANEHPGDSNKEISVRLGTMWKSLSEDTKNTYYGAAKKADQEHKEKYPGYYYSPKEARLRKAVTTRKSPKVIDGTHIGNLILHQEVTTINNDEDEDVQIVENLSSSNTETAVSDAGSVTSKTSADKSDVSTNGNEEKQTE